MKQQGYIPEFFVPYNRTECTDYEPALTANSNTTNTFWHSFNSRD